MPAKSDLGQSISLDLLESHLSLKRETVISASGTSMLPTIRPGQKVRVHHRDSVHFSVGDIVLVRDDTRLVIHRLQKIERDGGGAIKTITTKGDNSSRHDPPYEGRCLLGKVSLIERRLGLGSIQEILPRIGPRSPGRIRGWWKERGIFAGIRGGASPAVVRYAPAQAALELHDIDLTAWRGVLPRERAPFVAAFSMQSRFIDPHLAVTYWNKTPAACALVLENHWNQSSRRTSIEALGFDPEVPAELSILPLLAAIEKNARVHGFDVLSVFGSALLYPGFTPERNRPLIEMLVEQFSFETSPRILYALEKNIPAAGHAATVDLGSRGQVDALRRSLPAMDPSIPLDSDEFPGINHAGFYLAKIGNEIAGCLPFIEGGSCSVIQPGPRGRTSTTIRTLTAPSFSQEFGSAALALWMLRRAAGDTDCGKEVRFLAHHGGDVPAQSRQLAEYMAFRKRL